MRTTPSQNFITFSLNSCRVIVIQVLRRHVCRLWARLFSLFHIVVHKLVFGGQAPVCNHNVSQHTHAVKLALSPPKPTHNFYSSCLASKWPFVIVGSSKPGTNACTNEVICQNGGTCVPGDGDGDTSTCECLDGWAGLDCSGRSLPPK